MTIEPWVDSRTVAGHIGKSVFTVRNRAKAGILPGIKAGRDWLFKLSEVDASLKPEPVDPWAQSVHSRSRKRVT